MGKGASTPRISEVYAEQTAAILDELGKHLENEFKSIEKPTDYEKSLTGLNFIIQQNLYYILHDFSLVYRVYQTVAAVRIVTECVADAVYLQKNPSEATKYFNAQQKIQEDLKSKNSHMDKWKVFKQGDINKYGMLDKTTTPRLKAAYGSDGLGMYNFLCFYTHPNIAGAFWLKADSDKGLINLYLIQIMNKALHIWLGVLGESDILEVDAKYWSERLAEVHTNTLSKIKTNEVQK